MRSRPVLITGLILAALIILVVVMFYVQNSSRVTQLSLDLMFAAWELDAPMSVPLLMAICFGVGVVPPTLYFGVKSMRLSSKVRSLQQQVNMQKDDADPWS